MSVKSKMTAIADKIRSLLGISGTMGLDSMSENLNVCQFQIDEQGGLLDLALSSIRDKAVGETIIINPVLQDKTIIPTEETQHVLPDNGYNGLGTVCVEAIPKYHIGSGVPSIRANIYTPGQQNQIIEAGQYIAEKQTILGDEDLIAENVKQGVNIFGIEGTYTGGSGIDTSDATATSDDIASGVTAYANGEKITGNVEVVDSGFVSIFDDAYGLGVVYSDGENKYYSLTSDFTNNILFRNGSSIEIKQPASNLGDADASDVMKGKTFTSENGTNIIGTYTPPSGLPNGISGLSSGTFKLSRDSASHTISHNLGSSPNFVFVSATGDIVDSSFPNYVFYHSMLHKTATMYGINAEIQVYSISGHSDGAGFSTHFSYVSPADSYFNSSKFILEPSNDATKFKAGVTYRWVCGVADI
jgi:hypothetical protein